MMKKIIAFLMAFTMCVGFSSCGESLTENENKIYEALIEDEYSYEEYGDIISCSNIYSYGDENDEQYPFLLIDMSNKVDSYCYIDFADDEEDVCVLVVEGDSKGRIFTYYDSAIGSAYLLVEKDFDLFKSMFPTAASSVDKLDEVVVKQFPVYGYDLFYIPDDSTINTKLLSKTLKSEKQ